MYDKDAVYINVPGNYTKKSALVPTEGEQGEQQQQQQAEEQPKPAGSGERMVMDLQDAKDTLAAQLADSELRIFANSTPMRAGDVMDGMYATVVATL